MVLLKAHLTMTIAVLSIGLGIGLSACTDPQKESAKAVGSEAKTMMTQAKEKSEELYGKSQENASDLADKANGIIGDVKKKAIDTYDVTAEKASDAMDATKTKVATLKTDASKKLKKVCISTKETLGKDPKSC